MHRITDDIETLAQVYAQARLGQHSKAIAKRLGITPGMVDYRIGKHDLRGVRKAFRNGESPEYEAVAKTIGAQLTKHERVAIVKEMKKRLKESRKKV